MSKHPLRYPPKIPRDTYGVFRLHYRRQQTFLHRRNISRDIANNFDPWVLRELDLTSSINAVFRQEVNAHIRTTTPQLSHERPLVLLPLRWHIKRLLMRLKRPL